jgi:FRG domain
MLGNYGDEMVERIFAESINSLSHYLNFIEKHYDQYDEFDAILFRGQREDWTLLPKLARLECRPGKTAIDAELAMVSSFKRRSLPYLESIPGNDFDWLAIAQHYGMATRLLDWTTNPLAALWFAVKKPATNGKDGVVWAFAPAPEDYVSSVSESPFETEGTRIFKPKHISKRIVAQNGWFTVHQYKAAESRFVVMEKNERYSNLLMKLRIPASAFPVLRFALNRCGINAATIFNDIAGICKYAEWKASLQTDESM